MHAFLQGFTAGGTLAGRLQVQHLVDDGVVHGWGLGQQRGNEGDRNRHRVWLPEGRYHRHHCVRDPCDQEARADQHRHLGQDTRQPSSSVHLSAVFFLSFLFSSHPDPLNPPLWVWFLGCGCSWCGHQSARSPSPRISLWRWSWRRKRRWCRWGRWGRRKGWPWRSSGPTRRPGPATSPVCKRCQRAPGRSCPSPPGAWWPRTPHTPTPGLSRRKRGGVLATYLGSRKKIRKSLAFTKKVG